MDKLTFLSMVMQLWPHDGVRVNCSGDTNANGTDDHSAREFCSRECACLWGERNQYNNVATVKRVESIKHMPRLVGKVGCWMGGDCTTGFGGSHHG